MAVEFGFIAAPFLFLLFAIMETALIFFAGQTLETAVADSGRLIMTGEAKNYSQTQFKDAVCEHIKGLFDCQNNIYVDVRTFSTFANVTMPTPLDANKNFVDTDFQYQKGLASDIVVVRLFYQWPVYLSLLHLNNMSGGKRLLVATAAFRNEPY